MADDLLVHLAERQHMQRLHKQQHLDSQRYQCNDGTSYEAISSSAYSQMSSRDLGFRAAASTSSGKARFCLLWLLLQVMFGSVPFVPAVISLNSLSTGSPYGSTTSFWASIYSHILVHTFFSANSPSC